MESDFVPNIVINGSYGKVVTGLKYLISANTHKDGKLWIESNCFCNRVRPTNYDSKSKDACDWHWVFEKAKYRDDFCTIGVQTFRSGWKYMEASPFWTKICPSNYDDEDLPSDAQDWRWKLSEVGNGSTISADTSRSGWLSMESNPFLEKVLPSSYLPDSDHACNWQWYFTPINYELTVELSQFNYKDSEKKDVLNENFTTQEQHVNIDSSEDKKTIMNYTRTDVRYLSWTFTKSNTTEYLVKLNAEVNYSTPEIVRSWGGKDDQEFNWTAKELFQEKEKELTQIMEHSSCSPTIITRPNTHMYIKVLSEKQLIEVPFTCTATFKARADRKKKNRSWEEFTPAVYSDKILPDKTVIRTLVKEGKREKKREIGGFEAMAPITSPDAILSLIKAEGYTITNLIPSGSGELKATIEGKFRGAKSRDYHTIDEYPLKD